MDFPGIDCRGERHLDGGRFFDLKVQSGIAERSRSEKLKDSELARLNIGKEMSEEIWLFARLFVPLNLRSKVLPFENVKTNHGDSNFAL